MNSQILTMGLNHASAPIPVREQVASATCLRDDALNHLHAAIHPDLFPESLVLSTCNRTEIYAVTTNLEQGASVLRGLFGGHGTFSDSAEDFTYSYNDREAVEHLFSVASGIDSLIVGEFEILGQVRNAYLRAAENRTIGPVLHHLFKDAIHVGKRAHTETQIGAGAASVAYAAVALARTQVGSLSGRSALIIGAGEMARRAATNLAEDGACTVIVTNRTFDRAVELAGQIGGRAIRFEELPKALTVADLVISATSAPHVLLSADMVRTAMSGRGERELPMIDIALPRDIDPLAAQIPGVRLSNIDDLQHLVDANRAIREQSVVQVRWIIQEELEAFWRWYAERRAVPVIADLFGRAEAIRAAELDKALRRLGHLQLSERDRNVIAALSAGIVSKLLAAPTEHLKERVQSGDGQVYLDTVRELFELDSDERKQLPSAL